MPDKSQIGEIIDSACLRSFRCVFPRWPLAEAGGISIIDAGGEIPFNFHAPRRSKIMVFGTPSANLEAFGLEIDTSLPSLAEADQCSVCGKSQHNTVSPGEVHWSSHPLAANLANHMRPFTRFDYSFEWNNLGFGRIGPSSAIWGVKGRARCAGAAELAAIYLGDAAGNRVYAGSYLALLDLPQASILWCARPVGPVDSVEWSVIENFISSWRSDELPCWPTLRQIPAGCNALVTMRLDCDEDVASARPLFEAYAAEQIPFSLAVRTSLPMKAADLRLLRDVKAQGGALLSHSHNHEYGWGVNYEAALQDACKSRQWFRDNLPGIKTPENAVSPFHSNPVHAARALADAGFEGMVGGIIRNDPQYLMGRAGKMPFAKINGISQQAMLHGDCVRAQGGIGVYVRAFEAHYAAKGIFGYLDHPFSGRYQYGWDNESERISAHMELAKKIRQFPGALFWNEDQCFDFLKLLNRIHFVMEKDRLKVEMPGEIGQYRPGCLFRGEELILA